MSPPNFKQTPGTNDYESMTSCTHRRLLQHPTKLAGLVFIKHTKMHLLSYVHTACMEYAAFGKFARGEARQNRV